MRKTEDILRSLMEADIDPNRRGETLSLQEFARLSESLLYYDPSMFK